MATEKRLIDANELRTQFDDIPPYIGLAGSLVQQYIDKAPTVDAVEVVRCAKCKHWNPRYEAIGMCMKHNSIVTFTKPDFYCAWGERKNDGICKED